VSKRKIFYLLVVTVAIASVCVSILAHQQLRVNITGPSPSESSKLKIDVTPEDVIVGEKVKIVVRNPEGKPVRGAKVYVARNHNLSAKGTYIGETNFSGVVTYAFKEDGQHIIYVEKDGFLPQWINLYVKLKGKLSFGWKLKESGNGELTYTMCITSNGYPVEKVEIYVNSTFIGYTDNNGELSYTFKRGKVYEIIIKKEGYRGLLIISDLNPEGGTGTVIQPLNLTNKTV